MPVTLFSVITAFFSYNLVIAYCQEPANVSISSQFSRFECLLPADGLFTTNRFSVYFSLNHFKEVIDM